jgi:hypothetical protein
MTADRRLTGVDFLRAVACLIVVAHHLIFRLDTSKAPEWAKPLLQFGVNGSFGVAIFFALSGFLLARPFWLALDGGGSMPSMRVYALRRAARILPGFWLALTITFLLSFMLLGATLDAQLLARYLAGLLLVSDWHWVSLFPVESNGPLWSIGFEISSYVLLPLCFALLFWLKPMLGGKWVMRGIWVGVIGATLAVHWLILNHAPIDDVERGWKYGIVGGAKAWMPRYNPIGFFAIFALGALASGVQVMWRRKSSYLFDMAALLSFGTAIWLMARNIGGLTEGFGLLDIPYGFPTFPLAVAVFLAVTPSSRVLGRIADNRVSRFIARISFGVYLWHFLIITLMGKFLRPSFDNGAENVWANWLGSSAVALAASIGVGALSFYLLEQPVVNWARGLERQRAGDKAVSVPA